MFGFNFAKNVVTNHTLRSSRLFSCLNMNSIDEALLGEGKKIIPDLLIGSHKGTCGRIGIFGGSVEFTGAPYFAGISALKTGADLVYVFTASSAAQVIKSYSPELMVMPFLDSKDAVEQISPWLKRLHTVLIGPGLGRRDSTFETISEILEKLKYLKDEDGNIRPLVFDADGLYFLMKNLIFLEEYPGDIYLTPNKVEFSNLAKAILGTTNTEQIIPEQLQQITEKYGPKLTIVLKWSVDVICNDGKLLECSVTGSNRRCGGQGDLLSGILSTFAGWVAIRKKYEEEDVESAHSENMLAAYNSCSITRTCNRLAFEKYSRSMLATDMTHEIHNALKILF